MSHNAAPLNIVRRADDNEKPSGPSWAAAWSSSQQPNRSDVLLVEDDERLSNSIDSAFIDSPWRIKRICDAKYLLGRLDSACAVILDRFSGGRCTLRIVDEIRSFDKRIPIIVISSTGSVNDRIKLLYAGIDEYMTKPISMDELLARVFAIRRRCQVDDKYLVIAGSLRIDRLERTVHRGSRKIDLLPREFKLLEFLVQNAGNVTTRSDILRNVWQLNAKVETNSLDVCVGKLRQKLRACETEDIIVNVRGVGFRIVIPRD